MAYGKKKKAKTAANMTYSGQGNTMPKSKQSANGHGLSDSKITRRSVMMKVSM